MRGQEQSLIQNVRHVEYSSSRHHKPIARDSLVQRAETIDPPTRARGLQGGFGSIKKAGKHVGQRSKIVLYQICWRRIRTFSWRNIFRRDNEISNLYGGPNNGKDWYRNLDVYSVSRFHPCALELFSGRQAPSAAQPTDTLIVPSQGASARWNVAPADQHGVLCLVLHNCMYMAPAIHTRVEYPSAEPPIGTVVGWYSIRYMFASCKSSIFPG